MNKEDIIAEIRRTAEENGGKPLGMARFEQLTGIRPYDWGKHWARFGDAQAEAGYEPNKLTTGFTDEFLLGRLADLTKDLQRFPTDRERQLKRHQDNTFPAHGVYKRLGSRKELIAKLYLYCQNNPHFVDVVKILEPIYEPAGANSLQPDNTKGEGSAIGFVYLVRGHPSEYKIGRTNLVDRRLSELGATASIEQQLVHEIKTDDPAGIEAYWHRRFADKRMRGEWFKLSPDDVKTFKRWRHIY